jgi:hypothetical protein
VKDWVIPFLSSQNDHRISREVYLDEIGVPLFAHRRLADLFNTFNFSPRLKDIFGLTLSEMPEKPFLKIKAMSNLHFFYDDQTDLACVQEIPTLCASIVLVRLAHGCVELSDLSLTGLFAHEICHICLKHHDANEPWQPQGIRERAADDLAITWGFGDAIAVMRDTLKTLI